MIRGILKFLAGWFFLWGGCGGAVNQVYAFHLQYGEVASGYSNCSMTDNGNGTTTVVVNINFNDASKFVGAGAIFRSRAIIIHAYDKFGMPKDIIPESYSLGGALGYKFYQGADFRMLFSEGAEAIGTVWGDRYAFSSVATISFKNAYLSAWPAITVQAGIYTSINKTGDTGNAYIGVESQGTCKRVVDPIHPPPPSIVLTVSAPDWDLGEIKLGEQDIPLTRSEDRLCMTYNDMAVADGQQFIIDADSNNGVVNNLYQLNKVDGTGAVIPYELKLSNTRDGSTVRLPNSSLNTLKLDSGGKTCFLPTFKTHNKNAPTGDYIDALTFNVVTKS